MASAGLLSVGLAVLPPSQALAATNLMTNGGFESGSTAGWTCTSAAVVGTPTHTGAHALSGTPTSSDDAQCSQVVSVAPSSAYTLTEWVQGSFVFIGATGTGGSDPSTFTQSAPSFTQLSVSFNTGAATTSVTVFVHGWYAQPTYFADDVVLSGPAGSGGGTGGGGIPAPDAPTGLTVTGTTASAVSLSWTAPAGTVTDYNVYRNGTQVASTAGTSATVSGLSSETTFTFAVTAVNQTGESARSASVQATTKAAGGGGTGGGGALPRHVLTGYWQDFDNGATPLRLADVPAAYDLVAVAFANTDPTRPGGVTFGVDSGLSTALGGYTDAQFTADIATLHAQGRKVILSVGGQNGTVSVSSAASATNFADSVFGLMRTYGFDGVDIDLENGVSPANMASALRQLSAMAGPGLIITLAPQTIDMQSTGGGYFQLALDIQDILTIVNTQYYNSGTMLGCDSKVYAEGTEDFQTALACIQVQGGLRPDQIGLGLPASSRAAGGGVVAPSVVNSALDCLASLTHCGTFTPPTASPAIRGAMTWSINWDASNGFAFANTVGAHVHALP
ncbi:MAG TPA: glycosyl hydrolase family 18 protein [Mycobacteriales bacterium]|nr:glycosyl hydrolase family 18 protein [Mycobacteriales bacterium]